MNPMFPSTNGGWAAPDIPAEARRVAAAAPIVDRGRAASPRALVGSPVGRLQPRTVGSVLDAGFEVLRYRFQTIALVCAAIVLPLAALPLLVTNALSSALGDSVDASTSNPWARLGVGVDSNSAALGGLVTLLGGIVASALVGVAVGHMVASWSIGADPGPSDTLRFAARRAPVAAGAAVLALLIKSLGLIACGLGFVVAVALLTPLGPVLAAEPGLGPWTAVRRTWRLASRRFGAMIGLTAASAAIFLVFSGIEASVNAVLVAQVVGARSWAWVVSSTLTVLFRLVVTPLQAAWAALMYLDLRVRTEGLDIELETTELLPDVG